MTLFEGSPAVWIQPYDDPMYNWAISTLVSALSVLVLLGLLASGRASAWKAALAGLITASLVAPASSGMPASMVARQRRWPPVFAAFRIVWLMPSRRFSFMTSLAAQIRRQFEVMKALDRPALGA